MMSIWKNGTRTVWTGVLLAIGLAGCNSMTTSIQVPQDRPYMNQYDIARDQELKDRAADWRNGAIVYQILVDRFAPSEDLDAKIDLYAPPRRLRDWSEEPRKGVYSEEARVWTHEIDFWGGDLDSLRTNLDYVDNLGVDVVYLNPIFESFTNHKYDAWDYMKVDPVYGTREDLRELSDELHSRGMKLVFDGVFNHMGRQSPYFQEALHDENSEWRDFFVFTDQNDMGYVGWWDVENLPELNLENPKVQDYIYGKPDSVIQSYLREEGVDGWRLDVAFDIGFSILDELTRAAHEAKPGSLIVGEIYNYPEEWSPSVDAVMNMHGRLVVFNMLWGNIEAPVAADMWETMIADAGLEPILKSWFVLDNHDTSRLPTMMEEKWQQDMARVLQFTLPGSVCMYYGSELGMDGGEDPEQRGPMRWDLVNDENETLAFCKDLIELRKSQPALRYGDFRKLHTSKAFAFLRRTNSVHETITVVANPTDEYVREVLQLRESKYQDTQKLVDHYTGEIFEVHAGIIDVTVPPHKTLILLPNTVGSELGYNRFDRLN